MSAKLAQILEDQYIEAKAKAGQTVVRKLSKGLRIEILMQTTNEVRLTLTRDDTYPSPEEWKTVVRFFPFQVPNVIPNAERKGSRYLITARFASQRVMQLKF